MDPSRGFIQGLPISRSLGLCDPSHINGHFGALKFAMFLIHDYISPSISLYIYINIYTHTQNQPMVRLGGHQCSQCFEVPKHAVINGGMWSGQLRWHGILKRRNANHGSSWLKCPFDPPLVLYPLGMITVVHAGLLTPLEVGTIVIMVIRWSPPETEVSLSLSG